MSRRPLDFYETPPHYVEALQRVIGAPTGRILMPCVGKSQLRDALHLAPSSIIITNDLNPKRHAMTHLDATRQRSWARMCSFGRPAWCIDNPPFGQELPMLRHALRYCDNVAMLARLSFLEPTIERRLFWARWQAGVEVIVLPRYSFKRVQGKRATDNMTCCWLVWRDGGSALDSRQFHVALGREQRLARAVYHLSRKAAP